MNQPTTARICAGIPASNNTLYRLIQFNVGDPTALLEIPTESGTRSVLLLRNIEMERARKHAHVDQVACPADFTPESGLSGDRETATAQAAAECFRSQGIDHVVADRSLPLIYAEFLKRAGIEVACDENLWVNERRAKSELEVDHLREAQRVTEQAIQHACEMIATAEARKGGVLFRDDAPLTSEIVRTAVDVFLLKKGFTNPSSIIACGPMGADCHNIGSGNLVTGHPVIVDVFPRSRSTLYNGDCTRTVVHGEIPDEIKSMHSAVRKAKAAAEQATYAGATGEQVHQATIQAIRSAGYEVGLPGDDAPDSYCAMTHGTGHGIGLDVHEPPLLDMKGPPLLIGDALTIEPGLYRRDLGGVRIEDMVIVTADGCENLNSLSDELVWK
ncbi:Xaa-Pro peptidase family protein [Planctomicrobium sp.]|jgi:Xaa-Pro aminopeptidase|nr:Xaa-Pro peptidase family protein [Planctomicrobium sp.]MDB4743114.1 Xaa-Pro peptidase family protein [Planctomicrobium sp.]